MGVVQLKPVRRFVPDEDVKSSRVQWFQQQPREFFVPGIHQLVVAIGYLHQRPRRLFLTASTPSLRTIPEGVSIERAYVDIRKRIGAENVYC
jgi:hypothetical protein